MSSSAARPPATVADRIVGLCDRRQIPAPESPLRSLHAPQALVVLLAAVLCWSLLPTPEAEAATQATSMSRAERQVVDLINRHRASRGAPALTPRADLHAVARDWSFEQAESGQLGHNPSRDSSVCCWTRIGENVARKGGQGAAGSSEVARAVFELWTSSGGHDQTQTDPGFDQVGIGIVRDDDGNAWATAVFRTCGGAGCAGGAQGPGADTGISWGPPPAPVPAPKPAPAPKPPPAPAPPPPSPEPEPSPTPSPTPEPLPSPVLPSEPPPPPPPPAPSPTPVEVTPLRVATVAGEPSDTAPDHGPAILLLGACLSLGATLVIRRR